MIDLEKEYKAFEKEWFGLGGKLDCFDLGADKMYHLNSKSPHLTLNEQAMAVSAINTALAMYLIQARTKQSEIDSLKDQLAKYESGEFVMVPKECPDPEFSDALFEMFKPVCFGDVGDDAFVAVSDIDEQKVWDLMVKLAQGDGDE